MAGKQSDFEKPFPERYLLCAQALVDLEHWLMVVGLSGNKDFERLKSEFIKHGAVTARDIYRNTAAVTGADRGGVE
jgi:hypothetical protein